MPDPEPGPEDTPDPPRLNYAEPGTPRPPFGSDEPESARDVAKALGIVMLTLVALFLVIAMLCGGLL